MGLEQPAAAPAALATLFTRNKSAVAWPRLASSLMFDDGRSPQEHSHFQFKEHIYIYYNITVCIYRLSLYIHILYNIYIYIYICDIHIIYTYYIYMIYIYIYDICIYDIYIYIHTQRMYSYPLIFFDI